MRRGSEGLLKALPLEAPLFSTHPSVSPLEDGIAVDAAEQITGNYFITVYSADCEIRCSDATPATQIKASQLAGKWREGR